MPTISVRTDAKMEQQIKDLLVRRGGGISQLIRDLVEKEFEGSESAALNSLAITTEIIQERMSESIENIQSLGEYIGEMKQQMVGQDTFMVRLLKESAFSTYMWRLAQNKKTPEEIAEMKTGFDEYLQKLSAEGE